MTPMRYTALALATCITLSTHAAVWYVKKADLSGTEDGRSWATAYKTIQPAIDAAFNDGGGEVWVAKGVYDEARISSTPGIPVNIGALLIRSSTAVYGGFSGREMQRSERNWRTNVTIIDGSVSRDGAPAYHVVQTSTNTVLDGFTIRGGKANGGWADVNSGGGILLSGRTITVENSSFEHNVASSAGGAVSLGNEEAYATFINCRFLENTLQQTSGRGGAVRHNGGKMTFTRCAFVGNSHYAIAIYGGSPTISGCFFQDNEGGIVIFSGGGAGVYNSVFTGNHSDYGGAIRVLGSLICDELECTYHTSLLVYGCTFYGNSATSSGGAMWSSESPQTVMNSIFLANIPNSTVAVDIPQNIDINRNCIIQDGLWHPDPLFVDAANGDFHLQPGSPAIDSGADLSTVALDQPEVTADFDGNPRPHGAGYDVGAYEFYFARSDTNQDGAVNAVDVQAVINAVLGIGSTGNCDVNRDGQLNAIDVQITINDALGM